MASRFLLRSALYVTLGVLFFGLAMPPTIGTSAERMAFATVQNVVANRLSKHADHRPGDLISARDVTAILRDLAKAGWRPADQKQMQADTLKDTSALVKILSTNRGRRFMRKVSGYDLIFDRLDRITRVSGGERMLQDLVKLPNGHKYAKMNPKRGVPNLLDLIPKTRSGRTRTITDYRKATGRIYTQEGLLKRLKASHSGKGEREV